MNDESERPTGRRTRRRISGGGGSGGSMSLNQGTQSYGAMGEDEAPDGDLNDTVESQAEERAGFVPPRSDDFTPANRLDEVKARTRGSQYEREYRLQLLHRMLMRRVPLDEVARELGVSVQTVIRDRKELYNRLKDQAKTLDINHLIGDTIGFYDEVKSMGLRAASNSKYAMNARLGALRTALAAKNDMHRFLQAAGVFDVLRFKSADEGSTDDIAALVEISKAILESEDGKFDESKLDLPLLSLNDDEDEEVRLF